MVSRARASKAAILLAVCGLGLGACSAHPGTAAIVGDTRISEADVSLTSQQLSGLLGQDVDASRLLPTLNQNLAIGKVAEKNGITVSDQEITDSLAEMGQEVVQRGGKSTPITNPSPLLKTIIKNSIAQQKLRSSGMSQEQLAQANAELANTIQTTKVEINPRYGTLDAQSGSLTQGVFGDVIRANSRAQK
mgnify:FL=1